MISRAIVKAWLLNATVVATVMCSACTTPEKKIYAVEKKIDTVNQPLFVQLDIESGRINGVTQEREFKRSELGDGIKSVVSLNPQATNIIEGVTDDGQFFRCCGHRRWVNCLNVSEVLVAYRFNPLQNTYEIDSLGTPDGNGGVIELESIDFDPTATIEKINMLNFNIGMFEQDAGTGTFVAGSDGSIWNSEF